MSEDNSSVGPGALMTPEEIHDFGVGVVAKQLEKEGYELISVNPRMGLHPQIVATHKATKAFIAVRTAVYPGNGRFENLDAARALIITAKTHGGIAYLASVGIANAAGFQNEREDLALAGTALRGAGFLVNYRGLQPVVNLAEVKVLGPSGPEQRRNLHSSLFDNILGVHQRPLQTENSSLATSKRSEEFSRPLSG